MPKSRSLAVAEHKAPRTVAELRSRLDSGETPELWAASCVLSPRVLSYLTEEELAMLPEEVRGPLPEFPDEEVTIRREPPPEPCAQVAQPPSRPLSAIIVIVASVLACLCAVYFIVTSS